VELDPECGETDDSESPPNRRGSISFKAGDATIDPALSTANKLGTISCGPVGSPEGVNAQAFPLWSRIRSKKALPSPGRPRTAKSIDLAENAEMRHYVIRPVALFRKDDGVLIRAPRLPIDVTVSEFISQSRKICKLNVIIAKGRSHHVDDDH
jgi:hypothetical protein